MTYRVRNGRPGLTAGERQARERAILAALAPEERDGLARVLATLQLPADAPWYDRLTVRRLYELLAWLRLTADAEATGLGRRAAQDVAARQLGQHPDTLRTRLR